MKPLDEFGASEDHYHSHHERAHDAPKKHAVLVFLGYFEERKDQQEDEQVVDRQRELDEVSRQEQFRLNKCEIPIAVMIPDLPVYEGIEKESERYPNDAPAHRLFTRR